MGDIGERSRGGRSVRLWVKYNDEKFGFEIWRWRGGWREWGMVIYERSGGSLRMKNRKKGFVGLK